MFDLGEAQAPPAQEPRAHLAFKSIVLDQPDVERGAPVLSPLELQPHGLAGACLQVVLLDGCIDGVPGHGSVRCPLPTWGNTRSPRYLGKQEEWEPLTHYYISMDLKYHMFVPGWLQASPAVTARAVSGYRSRRITMEQILVCNPLGKPSKAVVLEKCQYLQW